MPRKRKIINKKHFKLAEGRCRICHEDDYDLLDVHRIIPGAAGGKYVRSNSVVVCCSCHRKIHSAESNIEIDRYYPSSRGRQVLLVKIDGEEKILS